MSVSIDGVAVSELYHGLPRECDAFFEDFRSQIPNGESHVLLEFINKSGAKVITGIGRTATPSAGTLDIVLMDDITVKSRLIASRQEYLRDSSDVTTGELRVTVNPAYFELHQVVLQQEGLPQFQEDEDFLHKLYVCRAALAIVQANPADTRQYFS